MLIARAYSRAARALSRSSVAITTLVPLKVYFHHGMAKLELAVARGKRQWDKRQAMAERDAKRETERALRSRNRGGD